MWLSSSVKTILEKIMGTTNTKIASYGGLSTIAGVSALAGIIVFIFFGPSGTRHKHGKRLPVKGLANMGQTCYVSAVIQSLASCPHFRQWLLQCNNHNYPTERPISHLFPLVSALHRAFLVVNRQDQGDISNKTFNPQVNILGILSSMNYRLARGSEQDTFELFEHILSALQEETARMVEKSNVNDFTSILPNLTVEESSSGGGDGVESLIKAQGGGDTDTELPHENNIIPTIASKSNSCRLEDLKISCPHIAHRLGYHHSVKKGLPLNPFVGATASRLTCLTCFTHHKWILEKNQGFSLHLPQQTNDKLTIRDLLNNYLRTVIVHEVECQGCSAKNGTPSKSSFTKVTVVIRLPRSLCLQIQRSAWNAFGSHKRSDYVNFEEFLDLSSIQRFKDTLKKSPKSKALDCQENVSGLNHSSLNYRSHGCLYRLCAVISHYSSSQIRGTESGHFVAYRRGPIKTDSWFLTSDEDVSEVPLVTVMSSNAYMLFYELVDGDVTN